MLAKQTGKCAIEAAQSSTLPDLSVTRTELSRQHFVVIEDFLTAKNLKTLKQVCRCTNNICPLHGCTHCAHTFIPVITQECDTVLEAQRGAVGGGAGPDWITSRFIAVTLII